MSRTGTDAATATILLAVAAATARLLITGEYLSYVRPVMAPFLTASVAVLTLLAGWTLRDVFAGGNREPGHLPRVAWLMLWPVVLITAVGPQSLGAYTAARSAVTATPPPPNTGGYLPLPAGDPLGVSLDVYAERSAYGGETTLAGRRFSILGFVSPGPRPDTWYLTRLQIRCCAADAVALRVLAVGAPSQRPGVWLQATGRYLPAGPGRVARLQVETVAPGRTPDKPYVYG